MRVLMLGWEFPPHSSGGLGTACYGIVKGLAHQNIPITLILPTYDGQSEFSSVKIRAADQIENVTVKRIPSMLSPYMTETEYRERLRVHPQKAHSSIIYGKNLIEEVLRYAAAAQSIAHEEEFDIIHAHDWLTFTAGLQIKHDTGKPLVVHVHATEFDRSGDNPNPYVYSVERQGMQEADAIIAVSEYTKRKIIKHYGVPEHKIKVVYNAVEQTENAEYHSPIKESDKIILFLGRITMQKGPDYFIYAAKMVAQAEPNVKFIIAGTGDMEPFIIEKAVEMGLADKIIFTGFLTGADIDRAYKMADLYVMPSVSEPFGITALEAIRNGTPVLISKQSGVSEVIKNCLKVDFWDVQELANKIISVLRYHELGQTLREEATREVTRINWDETARQCTAVYQNLVMH